MISDPKRVARGALAVGLLGLIACAVGWRLTPASFYTAWLAAFVFWLGLPLGALGLLLIHALTGGAWGVTLRPGLAAATAALPGFLVAVVPVLIGVSILYGWARGGATTGYLNPPFFIARAALYLIAWIAIAWALRGFAALALIALALTASLAAVDWTMSLQHPWGSTSYAMVELIGQLLAGLSAAILVAVALGRPTQEHLHDIGNLLMAGVLLWGYLAFTQYLIIWSEDLASEIPFYLARRDVGWNALAILVAIVHFVLPFLLLLRPDVKRSPTALGALALVVLAGRLLYVWWLVVPATPAHAFSWLDPLAMLAIGGLFVWFVLDRLSRDPSAIQIGGAVRERPA